MPAPTWLCLTAALAALAGGRLRPPEWLDCPRDRLTSFTGAVVEYRRGDGETFLRMDTDEETREEFTLRHPGGDDPGRWFRIEGEPFTAEDWQRIETAKGHLRPALRATVWVCEEGEQNPVVDWRPDEKTREGEPVP